MKLSIPKRKYVSAKQSFALSHEETDKNPIEMPCLSEADTDTSSQDGLLR
jgi:hypothetical protein